MHHFILLVLLGLLRLTLALCPGFNYAFFSLPNAWQNPYTKDWRWLVTDNSCNRAGPGCSNDNPCDCPMLGCAPALNTHVDKVVVNGLWYLCRWDPNAGSCDRMMPESIRMKPPVQVESCCRNDGRRNLAEGLISKREFDEIEATNAMLDIHKRDYAEALESGMSEWNITALRDVQMQELKEAEARQLVARNLKD